MNLVLDIGGTTTKFSYFDSFSKLKNNFKKIQTLAKYNNFLNFLRTEFRNLKFKKVCISFAGMIDKEKGKIIKAPNIIDYQNRFIKRDFEKIFKCKVYLENDAALAALGESIYGNGKNYKIIAYITLSTGIGGAKIVNKKIDENLFGFEPGHSLFLLDFSKVEFEELEKLISGKAIERIFEIKPENIKDKNFWKIINKIFSGFLVNVALFWSPEVIIIGGSLAKSLDFDLLKISFENLKTMPFKIKILKSKLEDLSALYGGYYLLNYFK